MLSKKISKKLSSAELFVLEQFLQLQQWPETFPPIESDLSGLKSLLRSLMEIDAFYRELGGLAGYQAEVLRALEDRPKEYQEQVFHAPPFVSLIEENDAVKSWTAAGIGALKELGMLVPLGGSADRLHLVDEETGEDLPAAKLLFAGRTLLEGLIRDVAAQELLYFQTFGEKVTVPIGLMTSPDKANHDKVLQICRQADWFGRGEENFFLFPQPLVPTVDAAGKWCWIAPYRPFLKPGGHGALWKLAEDRGVFSWMAEKGKRHLLVRQINNPMAGLDYGLLAFLGYGVEKEMDFGFASCPRMVHAAEGMNVLVERGSHLVLTNIEYCDFAKYGIEDLPIRPDEPYSRFSSNTNILFTTLQAARAAVKKSPYPGLLINMKPGRCTLEHLHGRLESTMQNLADVFVEEKKGALATTKTFVTYNHRHKTIATAKKAYLPGGSFQETPENCFYELLRAMRLLLSGECAVSLPKERSLEETLLRGPSFVFTYHPALGPLYSQIREKIQRGTLEEGAFCSLEIADLFLHDFSLAGSLEIESSVVSGTPQGKCSLRGVRIENKGVDWEISRPFWKNRPVYRESCKVVFAGRGEFIAENAVFSGNYSIVVPENTKIRVRGEKEGLIWEREEIPAPVGAG